MEDAWTNIKIRKEAIAKSFLVTGISNAFGTWEEKLVRNDELRNEIDEHLSGVFGVNQLRTAANPLIDDPFDDVSSDPDSSVVQFSINVQNYTPKTIQHRNEKTTL